MSSPPSIIISGISIPTWYGISSPIVVQIAFLAAASVGEVEATTSGQTSPLKRPPVDRGGKGFNHVL